jgi:hypothetical protein
METLVSPPVICITSMPATRRSSSGMRVMPERRMSWRVMIVVELGESSGLCAPRDAVMTVS